ncbi:hypothetical protein I4U23_021318 [Adineta vaga]|nr:hypothetical protein I4U23_021318 [Adineta vaga]
MPSITIDHQVSNKLEEYKSIFEHYNFERLLPYKLDDDKLNRNLKQIFDVRRRSSLERNSSSKKTVNAKVLNKKLKSSSPSVSNKSQLVQNKTKRKGRDGVIKIKVPDVAKARKATYSSGNVQKQQLKKNIQSPKVASSVPKISLHPSSSTSINTIQKLPALESKSDVQSNTTKSVRKTLSTQSASAGEPSPMTNVQIFDLDDINAFTRDMFANQSSHNVAKDHRYRIRLNCPVDSDDHLTKYIQSRSHCLDVFEEYVNNFKRQNGLIRDAASDSPIFDPGISITGPHIKKDAIVIDKEDTQVIKRLKSMEPRKKYALVHESVGIFVIGGYNLYVDVPVQRKPTTDYLVKFTGELVKIPPLHPCRVHFGICTDGEAIYIAGGQTIQNELLDDIQCLNLNTLKWKHVATLMNPIAACGMTLDQQRIYLVGGYDILQNQTFLLPDYTVYNLATRQFEKFSDLPKPRCRSLVFATNHAIFCISGLVEGHDGNGNKKMQISNDILKWTLDKPKWIKVSQTPTLSKFHALSFHDPYLEITKRAVHDQNDSNDSISESYYDFRTNIWMNGRAPASPEQPSAKQSPSKSKGSLKSATPTCHHRRFECIQVSYRGIHKCITNFNRITTVANIIDALLDDSLEKQYFSINDCCLYVESPPYLYPLKPADFIQDVLLRYASSDINFKLSFKRNSSPSRFAQRKKLLRTPVQQPKITNAYEQLRIQESLIRKQHEIITQLRKTTLSNNYSSSSNYATYFDWVTRTDDQQTDSDDSRSSSDIIPICRRQSRQDEYHQAINRPSTRSLSRVRFHTSAVNNSSSPIATEMKSILKKVSPNYSTTTSRTTSVDRNITRLTSLKQRQHSAYTSDDELSDHSTTDSCIGSLSSDDNNSSTTNQHHLETLV